LTEPNNCSLHSALFGQLNFGFSKKFSDMFCFMPSLEGDDRESLKINFQIRRVAFRPAAFEKSCLIDHQPI
jgi:hypothetical protein